nr:MAG TPA: hypothetical protein [Caudoviricetes sp.]
MKQKHENRCICSGFRVFMQRSALVYFIKKSNICSNICSNTFV